MIPLIALYVFLAVSCTVNRVAHYNDFVRKYPQYADRAVSRAVKHAPRQEPSR